MNIYVGNLPYGATEDELKTAFAAFGEVSSVNLIMDKFSGQSKGFAFVEMADNASADAAIKGCVDDLDRFVFGAAAPFYDALPAKAQNGKGLSGFAKGSGFHDNLLHPTSSVGCFLSVLKKISRAYCTKCLGRPAATPSSCHRATNPAGSTRCTA